MSFIILLSFLYCSLAFGFHKTIPIRSVGLSRLYKSITPDTVLPFLNARDKMLLASGEMIEKQERNGPRGSGFVVVDIQSSPDVVFETLSRFGMYQEMIPIVRSSTIIGRQGDNTMAEFTFSRFLLRVNVKHTVVRDQRLITFALDPDRVNPVFREAEGFWHVEIPTDRPEGYCRVYLSAEVVIHKIVPTLLVDYAAATALNRATNWLKPYFARKTLK